MPKDAAKSVDTTSTLDELRADLAAQTAENDRLRSELRLRNDALDSASSHILIVDARDSNRPIVYANRALALAHGYQPAELIGQSVRVLNLSDGSPEQAAETRAALRAGRSVRMEMDVTRADGTRFLVGVHTTPILGADGRITHTVSIGADITARVESERRKSELQQRLDDEMKERERLWVELQLAQKLEGVGRLAAGVAHEINTPIQYVGDSVHFLRSAMEDIQRVLVAYQEATQALLADPAVSAALAPAQAAAAAADLEFLNAEIPKAFERTMNGVDRVAGIVRAMKEFAHPDATQHSPADLNHALETTLTVARNEYKYVATVETHFGELPQVLCNAGELNQVFLNLIVNATHAIQESGKDAATGHITVSTAVAGDNIRITIADNGKGIPPEIIEKIYDPFFTTKEVGKGTGQGLAIARSIVVDKHGGDLRVQSRVGEGAAFTITLPIAGRQKPAGK